MHELKFTDQELDYVYKVLIQRPMVEVEPLIVKIRQQVEKQNGNGNTPDGADKPPAESTPG
jgi:hypothetical protein